VVLEYYDPNPKGLKSNSGKTTLPITNNLIKLGLDFKVKYLEKLTGEDKIICCSQNAGICYYLYNNKRIMAFDVVKEKLAVFSIETKVSAYLIEKYRKGVAYPCQANKLAFVSYNFSLS
jgi:hypothetical protein